MYHEDHLNFVTSCKDCFDLEQEYWQERWDDLRADQMAGVLDARHRYGR